MEPFLAGGLLVAAILVLFSMVPETDEEADLQLDMPEDGGTLYSTFYPMLKQTVRLPLPRMHRHEKRIGELLVSAAWTRYYSAREYVCLQFLCGISAGSLSLLLLAMNPGVVLPWLSFLLPGLLLIGFLLPAIKLRDAAKKRQKKIQLALPFVLDLLTISIEAGLEFVQALSRIVARSHEGPIRDELRTTLQQLNMGTPRAEALEELAERVRLDEMKTLTSLLIQSHQMGSSVGPTLRAQAEVMRTRRMQAAEKLAQEAPVKMLFPIMIFILPCVFVVIIGPLVLELIKKFSGLGQ
jgi:tight adherence protein C